ncbi:MAG: hypothetical protein Q9162_005562 [Coniocarpon cinnabarinum]
MSGEKTDSDFRDLVGVKNPRDTVIQIAFSILLGTGAFLAFCVSLIISKKKRHQFLRFFKMALKFLTVTLFFALVVFKPVHDAFPDTTRNATDSYVPTVGSRGYARLSFDDEYQATEQNRLVTGPTDYLWMYLIFAYLFTGLAVYLLITETKRIISVRQEYLGNQATITDRTIRLSGIPSDLRTEEKIKEFIETLEIGKVDSIMLCRDWSELDELMEERMGYLRKLEESWTLYLGKRRTKAQDVNGGGHVPTQSGDEENGPLLGANSQRGDLLYDGTRPTATVRFGFLKLQSRYVDAIDYYEEKLGRVDERIMELRNKTFKPSPLAFVTLDSVPACQMAVQAVLDPSPMHLIAKPAPSPSDVVWENTYLPRSQRMIRAWLITIAIALLTVFWSAVLIPVAGVLQPRSIEKVWPQLAHGIESNKLVESLITTQLPTLVSTLLFVAVPYLYDWLANCQGMMSRSDVELSVISKNFFFSFFNYFIVFTVLGTAAYFYEILDRFRDSLRDTTWVASQLARSLSGLTSFYTNLIILQGLGLFPLRLLEIGSVALYPLYRMAAKTPRDYAELNQPPVFNYGFYLPQVMLILIICIVYSILRDSWQVLLAGIFYFGIGNFVYKYQLLYAMDHRQHSGGRAWTIICKRMIFGLILFQLTTAGQLLLKHAEFLSAAMAPLVIGTIWFSYSYSGTYDSLMEFIALRSIERKVQDPYTDDVERDPDGWGSAARLRYEEEQSGHTVDDSRETGTRFVNPSLVKPLEDVWVSDSTERDEVRASSHRTRAEGVLNALA